MHKLIILTTVALTSALADPPLYPTPGQGQDHFHNQYLPSGSHQSAPRGHDVLQFGHRGVAVNRFSDASPSSTLYGNLIRPSARNSSNRNSPTNHHIAPTNTPTQFVGFQASPSTFSRKPGSIRIFSGATNRGAGLYANPVPSGVLYTNSNQAPSKSRATNVGLGYSSGANLGSLQYGSTNNHLNHAKESVSNQHETPSGSSDAYSTFRLHNTLPPGTSRGSSYAVSPSVSSKPFSNINPVHNSIPLLKIDSGRYAAISEGYDAQESTYAANSARHDGAQRGSSRYRQPAGYNPGRTISPYDVSAPIYIVSEHTLQEDIDKPANYEFLYEVRDANSGNDFGHKESSQDDDIRGTYYVVLPDGRKQIVDYKATDDGYRPMVRYEDAAITDLGRRFSDARHY